MRIPQINILGMSQVAGVSICFESQTDYAISYCLLKKSKGEISIIETDENLASIEALGLKLPKNTPVVLNISGKQVLSKTFDASLSDEKKIVPVGQPDDFYNYEYNSDNTTGISICRKTIVDELLANFSELNIPVIEINIGPYLATSLWSYELISDMQIPISNGMLNKSGASDQFEFLPGETQGKTLIADQELSHKLILSYTAALNRLLGDVSGSFTSDAPSQVIEGFQYKQIIHRTKYLVLGAIFIALIINFLSFDSLRKKEAQIAGQLKMNSGILSKRDSLEGVLKAKEIFIEYIGNNKTSYSYFLDEIASTVPSKIVLNQLEINPLDSKIQKKEAIKVQKKIFVSGLAGSSLVLNQWINKLESLEWIREVIVLNYSRNEESNKGEFLIEVKTKK